MNNEEIKGSAGRRNPREPFYYGRGDIPQPYIAVMAEINNATQKFDVSSFKFPATLQNSDLTITGNSCIIKHNIGHTKYVVNVTPKGTTPVSYVVDTKTSNTVKITFSAATDFSLTISTLLKTYE